MKDNYLKEMYSLIVTKVSVVTGVTESEITGKSHKGKIAEAKHAARYLSLKNGFQLKDASKLLKCENGSLLSSKRRVEALMFSDKKFKDKFESDYAEFLIQRVRKPVYILGKITGEPYRKCYEKFEQREKQLNELGFMVVNPMKLVPPETPWHEAMRICIGRLVQCFAVSPLFDWQRSEGAKIEMNIAKAIELEIIP